MVRVTYFSQKSLDKYEICQRGLTFGIPLVLARDLIMSLLLYHATSLFCLFLFEAK